MTTPTDAQLRAEFEAWAQKMAPALNGPWEHIHRWYALNAYLAAASRYSAELADERARVRSFQDGYHAIAKALGTTVPETNDEDLVDRVERLRGELDAIRAECEAEVDGIAADYQDLARRVDCGDIAQAEEELIEAAKKWGEDQDRPGISDPDVTMRLRRRYRALMAIEATTRPTPPTPAPLDEARDALIQAANKQLYECELRGREAKEYRAACRATDHAADALRALQAPADPVGDALRDLDLAKDHAISLQDFDLAATIKRARNVLDSALAASERKP